MTCQHCYLAPHSSISTPVPSNVWFASWTTGETATWSQTKPADPDGSTTFAVAVVCESTPRNDLSPLGTIKDMPPPRSSFATMGDIDDFKGKFIGYTSTIRDLDLPANALITERD